LIWLFSIADRKMVKALTAPPLATPWGDGGPSISPDGRWLAFLRTRSFQSNDLYVVELAGGEPKRLTDKQQWIVGCAWTPDSRELVYFGADPKGGPSLCRIPITGGQPRFQVMTVAPYGIEPAISHQGSRLAYVEKLGKCEIWRVKLTGPAQERTANGFIASTVWEGFQGY